MNGDSGALVDCGLGMVRLCGGFGARIVSLWNGGGGEDSGFGVEMVREWSCGCGD